MMCNVIRLCGTELNANPNTTLITKRRWDVLLLPIAVFSGIAAVLLGVFAGFWQGLQVPGLTLILWAYLRYTTSNGGMVAVSINGNRKAQALLKWLSFFVVLTVGWVAIDTQVLGNPINAPLSMTQIVVFLLMIALLLAGVFVIERRFPVDPQHEPEQDGG